MEVEVRKTYTNSCKERLSQGELVLCMVINQGRTNDVVMMAASAGFHAIFVDMEHSAFSLETVSMLFTAALGLGLAPMVRVMSKSGQEFGTLFDIGAQGIIVPMSTRRRRRKRSSPDASFCRFERVPLLR